VSSNDINHYCYFTIDKVISQFTGTTNVKGMNTGRGRSSFGYRNPGSSPVDNLDHRFTGQ